MKILLRGQEIYNAEGTRKNVLKIKSERDREKNI